MRLQLSLSAQDLPNTSLMGGVPDPFAVVTLVKSSSNSSNNGSKPILLGQTEVLQNTRDPDWTKLFYVEDFELGTPTNLIVSIYTEKDKKSLGSLLFEVGAILGAPGSRLGKQLKGSHGTIIAHVEEATNAGTLRFQLRGLNFTNTEGAGVFNKSDPFFELQRWHKESRTWDTVFRSSHIQDNLNPIWGESFVEVHALCGGQPKQKFRILVLDHDRSGKHDAMGQVQLTLEELLEAVNENALKEESEIIDLDIAFTLTKVGKEVGKLLIAAAEVTGAVPGTGEQEPDEPVEPPFEVEAPPQVEEDIAVEALSSKVLASGKESTNEPAVGPRPTFVHYVSGGCQLRVVVAVDATASNGDPRKETSLHHFKDDGYNAYEDALYSVCSILAKYDSDQKYPVYGFSGKQNCFPMGSSEEVDGVTGILDAYRTCFRSGIVMSSPRDFTEVIRNAAQNARNQLKIGQSYSILLLLTNGDPADVETTVKAIRDAQDAPLSIIIVGIGNDSFSGIRQMVQDQESAGRRDLLQFVEYKILQNEHKLTQAALDHIPDQLVTYFVSKNILPLQEPEIDEIAVEPYNPSEEVEAPIEINEQGQAVVTTGDVKIPEQGKKFQKLMKGGMKEGKKLIGKIKKNKRFVGRIQRKVEQKILRMIK